MNLPKFRPTGTEYLFVMWVPFLISPYFIFKYLPPDYSEFLMYVYIVIFFPVTAYMFEKAEEYNKKSYEYFIDNNPRYGKKTNDR